MEDTLKFSILCLILIKSIQLLIASDEPNVVEIADGKIRGAIKKTLSGREYLSFTRIPYAKPPVGDLRFRPPEPAEKWEGILNATEEVPKCLQKDYISYSNPKVEGTEDCLYLNVFRPKSTDLAEALPVMVFIHWGGNVAGSSKTTVLGPEYFMEKDVILVTFNYRVGIFGFFSTLNDDAPGNWGPKDQLMVLRWVQNNIEYFGGDKNTVTIFGQSAGAGAVHHLILNPNTKGLFHRAISQSGTALCLWAKPLNQLQETIYRATAQIVGCDPTNTTLLLQCLRQVDGNALVLTGDAFKYFFRDAMIAYTYVTEVKTALNPEPFLEKDPIDIINSGEFNKIPWIIGSVRNEGALKTGPYLLDPAVKDQLLEKFDSVMPQNLLLEASIANNSITTFWENMKKFYLNGSTVDFEKPETVHAFTDMYGDRSFHYGIYQSALTHARHGHSPVWFYNFSFRGSQTYVKAVFMRDVETELDFDFGVCHCDDLLYLFRTSEFFPDFVFNKEEAEMKQLMISMWTKFAKTGTVPTNWLPIPDLSGQIATNKDLNYLDIQGPDSFTLRNNYRRKFMKFWLDAPIYENIPVEGLE